MKSAIASLMCLFIIMTIGCSAKRAKREAAGCIMVPFHFANTSDEVGSLTLVNWGSGYHRCSTDRPGDKLFLSPPRFGSGSVSSPAICIGNGSEIRIEVHYVGDDFVLNAEAGNRICFRKCNEGWIYLCGLGTIKYLSSGGTVHLGRDRTFDSCINLLSSSDPILVESATRSLARLTVRENAPHVISLLTPLLGHESLYVRRSAGETLGLIGNQECVRPLKEALAAEDDATTREYFIEALSILNEKGEKIQSSGSGDDG